MKRKIVNITLWIVILLSAYSFIPVPILYLKKDAVPATNEMAVEKLRNNTGEYFEFIVLSDNHAGLIFNDCATLKLIKRMNREDRFKKVPIDFAIVSGDVTFRGSLWDYRVYNKMRSLVKYPVISAIGNHDDDDDKGASESYFDKYCGRKEFSFADRNSYFIIIDNSNGDFSEKQFARLEEELKKSQEYKHRFIVAHKAPFSPYQQSWYRPEQGAWSYRFMKVCEEYKVDMMFAGHEHMFKKSEFGGVRYIVSAGGGMPTQIPSPDGGILHYTVVRVNGDYCDYEVRRVFPPLWEFLGFYMWKDLFYILKDVIY